MRVGFGNALECALRVVNLGIEVEKKNFGDRHGNRLAGNRLIRVINESR